MSWKVTVINQTKQFKKVQHTYACVWYKPCNTTLIKLMHWSITPIRVQKLGLVLAPKYETTWIISSGLTASYHEVLDASNVENESHDHDSDMQYPWPWKYSVTCEHRKCGFCFKWHAITRFFVYIIPFPCSGFTTMHRKSACFSTKLVSSVMILAHTRWKLWSKILNLPATPKGMRPRVSITAIFQHDQCVQNFCLLFVTIVSRISCCQRTCDHSRCRQ